MRAFAQTTFPAFVLLLIASTACTSGGATTSDRTVALLRHLATAEVPGALGGEDRTYCVGYGSLSGEALADPEESVLDALTAAGVRAQAVSGCELPINTAQVTDQGTGERRVLLLVKELQAPSHYQAEYYHGPDASALWLCSFAENEGREALPACKLLAES